MFPAYGLLGEKLGHSYSPLIHSLLADYEYTLCPCTPEELDQILSARDFRGMNVTIPYKKKAIAYCDSLSDEANALGNVNTLLVRKDGSLHGDNTDLHGFLSTLRVSNVDLRQKKAVILGGGGSGNTARAALTQMGTSEIITVSRSGPIDYDILRRDHTDASLIVNATPIGMYPQNGEAPIRLSDFPGCECVIDLIYNPYRTALLLDAEERGIPCRNGLWMLIAQAHRGAELFTGEKIPEFRIADIHAHIREMTENIILIGMPGSGKSSVGRAIAQNLGRTFVDLDDEITCAAGISIPEVFARYGEAHFRDLESSACERFGKEKSLVISTGGGAVLRPQNMRFLRQNGEIFFLERPLSQLATEGRPLSTDLVRLCAMYMERLPLYQKYAAAIILNTADIQTATTLIQEAFHEAVRH